MTLSGEPEVNAIFNADVAPVAATVGADRDSFPGRRHPARAAALERRWTRAFQGLLALR